MPRDTAAIAFLRELFVFVGLWLFTVLWFHGGDMRSRVLALATAWRLSLPLFRKDCIKIQEVMLHGGSCQNYGPFWGPYFSTAPNI